MTGSFCCAAEIGTTLSINSILIKKNKINKKQNNTKQNFTVNTGNSTRIVTDLILAFSLSSTLCSSFLPDLK